MTERWQGPDHRTGTCSMIRLQVFIQREQQEALDSGEGRARQELTVTFRPERASGRTVVRDRGTREHAQRPATRPAQLPQEVLVAVAGVDAFKAGFGGEIEGLGMPQTHS